VFPIWEEYTLGLFAGKAGCAWGNKLAITDSPD